MARRLGLQHIEAFRAVMLSGSMTAAAMRMHTSQPQISRLISQLETITRFPLFERNGTRIVPSLEGSRFFQEVEKTFIGLGALEAAASNIHAFRAGKLRIAAMPRLAGGLLPRIVARFNADYPNVMVSIHSGSASAVHDWISSGFCDIGIAMLYSETIGVEAETVLNTSCVAVLPKGHRLAARNRYLEPKDFQNEPFVSFPSGSALRDRIDHVFSGASVERQIVAEADLGASICALVAAGVGVSLINPMAAYEERTRSGIEIRSFKPSIRVSIALIYPPYHKRSRLVSTAGRYARRLIQEAANKFREHA